MLLISAYRQYLIMSRMTEAKLQFNDAISMRVAKVIASKLNDGRGADLISNLEKYIGYSLTADFNIDSLDLVELTMALEEEFSDLGIEIANNETDNLKTVGQIIQYIKTFADK